MPEQPVKRYHHLVGRPSYDEETLAAYFMPLDEAHRDHPVVGPVIERLAREDPDIIAAVADVDRSQIRDALERTPDERLRIAFGRAATLQSLTRVAR
jgi:hypothetical protein